MASPRRRVKVFSILLCGASALLSGCPKPIESGVDQGGAVADAVGVVDSAGQAGPDGGIDEGVGDLHEAEDLKWDAAVPDQATGDFRGPDAGAADAGPPDLIAVGDMAAGPSCGDSIKNGMETDVDCGGGMCPKCVGGRVCIQGADCASGTCSKGFCKGLGFSSPILYAPGGSIYYEIVAADFNQDGKVDVAVHDPMLGNAWVLFNQGGGKLKLDATYADVGDMVAADFDGDGKIDLATNADYKFSSILFNTGGGAFGPAIHIPMPGQFIAEEVQLADVDGNGRPDLIVSGGAEKSIVTVLNLGGRKFQAVETPVDAQYNFGGLGNLTIGVGDFDNDGKSDLVLADVGSFNGILELSLGGGMFNSQAQVELSTNARAFVPGDFDGDGLLDVAVFSEADSKVRICPGRGRNGFAFPSEYESGAGGAPLAVDFDGDGHLDLVSSDFYTISVILNDGLGGFKAPMLFPVLPIGGKTWLADNAVGDMNNDGKPDIVLSYDNYQARTAGVAVLLNTTQK